MQLNMDRTGTRCCVTAVTVVTVVYVDMISVGMVTGTGQMSYIIYHIVLYVCVVWGVVCKSLTAAGMPVGRGLLHANTVHG